MPEISVIVPVYKVEPYLRECVDSILAQTFTDFELILIDDGSPDNCGIICDEYAEKDNRIIVIHQGNGGLSAARNVGLNRSKGRYITFIDSDDVVSNVYLNRLYDGLIKNKCDISCCKLVEFRDDNQFSLDNGVGMFLPCSGRDSVIKVFDNSGDITITACSKMYRKELFNSIVFPVGKIHEDNYTVPILLYNSNCVCFCYEAYYGYRQRDNSIMSSSFTLKRYDGVLAADFCIDYFKKRGDYELANIIYTHKVLLLYLNQNEAKKTGIYSQVPKEYRISEIKTLNYLKKHLSDNYYVYQLAKVHPDWVKPHEYIRKIKKIFGIKVKD